MKNLLLTVLMGLMLLAGNGAAAQITHTASGSVDETATQVLKKAADKLKGGAFTVAVTVVNTDANKKETFRQKMTITYKSSCYKVTADDIEMYCDGKSVWQVNNNTREVIITPMSLSDDDITNPAALLANYNKNYRPKYIREEDGTAIIDLQPKKNRSFHKLRLFIETATGCLKKIEQHNYDSSRGVVTLGKYTTAKTTPETFKYSVPQGYEVVDMR